MLRRNRDIRLVKYYQYKKRTYKYDFVYSKQLDGSKCRQTISRLDCPNVTYRASSVHRRYTWQFL